MQTIRNAGVTLGEIMDAQIETRPRVAPLRGVYSAIDFGPPQAVILAAGRGSRLGPAIDERPKCLASIGGRFLIEHQLDLLAAASITRVAVVTGYRAEAVHEALGDRVTYFHNPLWANTEGLYSLHLCRNWVDGPMVVMNCDVLLEPEAMQRLLSGGNAFAFDSTSGADAEEMAVEFDGEWLAGMSKNLPLDRTHGENVGVLHFEARAAQLLFHEIEILFKAGATKARLPSAVQRVARYIPLRGIDVADLNWIEIDFPADLTLARQRVWPAIYAKLTAAIPLLFDMDFA